MPRNQFGLPRKLDDGLVLRWATTADVAELTAFNARVHSDSPNEPSEMVDNWTRDLMLGEHPTTGASDFTIVVDTNERDRIVSSLVLIPQKWSYGGIEFGCGRPELVGTDPAYRRRGLVRHQMEAVHAKSSALDHHFQAITGIPWFYRQFGYEMTVNLGGGRLFYWSRAGNDSPVDEEPYRLRPATLEDIPSLHILYEAHCAGSLIVRVRSEVEWRYELTRKLTLKEWPPRFFMVETVTGEPVAYVEYGRLRRRFNIRELGVRPGHSWRAVCLYLARALKKEADTLEGEAGKQLDHLYWNLGAEHPAYTALGTQLEKQFPPYAWYIRIADIGRFLNLISPVLEQRLATSVMAGHSGKLLLNFYWEVLELQFKAGAVVRVASTQLEAGKDGDVSLPDLSFLQLLLGYRTVEELYFTRADCVAWNAEARVLLDILFPKQASNIVPL